MEWARVGGWEGRSVSPLDRTISQGPARHKHVAIDLYWNTANTPAWVCSDMREVLVTWCVSVTLAKERFHSECQTM
ncbi:hypothetical protein J6590_023876 [Homalodisca vitripennis]|nr:hypothetical protein J6590_023876 [Homalodisca vitripennis]